MNSYWLFLLLFEGLFLHRQNTVCVQWGPFMAWEIATKINSTPVVCSLDFISWDGVQIFKKFKLDFFIYNRSLLDFRQLFHFLFFWNFLLISCPLLEGRVFWKFKLNFSFFHLCCNNGCTFVWAWLRCVYASQRLLIHGNLMYPVIGCFL